MLFYLANAVYSLKLVQCFYLGNFCPGKLLL